MEKENKILDMSEKEFVDLIHNLIEGSKKEEENLTADILSEELENTIGELEKEKDKVTIKDKQINALKQEQDRLLKEREELKKQISALLKEIEVLRSALAENVQDIRDQKESESPEHLSDTMSYFYRMMSDLLW